MYGREISSELAPRIVAGSGDRGLSTVNITLVARLFRESGAVLVRGYPHSAGEFEPSRMNSENSPLHISAGAQYGVVSMAWRTI